MAIGTTALVTGAVVGGINFFAGRAQRRAEADRADRDAKIQTKKNQSNYDRGSTQISLAREQLVDQRATAELQIDQAEDQYGRQTDAIDRQRNFTSREFDRALVGLQRGRRRAHERIHRDTANTMSAATAVGVRGGSGIDTVRKDSSDARSDLDFEANQERARLGDRNEDLTAQYDDMDAQLQQQIESARHGYSTTLNAIDRSSRDLDSAYDQLSTNKELDDTIIDNAVSDAEAAVTNPWNQITDVASGFSAGVGLSNSLFGRGATLPDAGKQIGNFGREVRGWFS